MHAPMDPQTWFKLTAHLALEDDDARTPEEPSMASSYVYLPENIFRCLERAPALSAHLLSASSTRNLVQACGDFDTREELLWHELGWRGADTRNNDVLAFAALNLAIHDAIEKGLPTDCALIVKPCNAFDIECPCVSAPHARDILMALPGEDLQRLRTLVPEERLDALRVLIAKLEAVKHADPSQL